MELIELNIICELDDRGDWHLRQFVGGTKW